jgi:predicted peptidase
MRYPERFAAIVPICGKGNPWMAYRLKDVPVWAFHGDKDSVIPVSESMNMEKALKDLKAEVKLTLYPGVEHNSWTQTYDNPEVYEWLLSHKKK